MPERLELNDNEYNLCIKISRFFDYLFKSEKKVLVNTELVFIITPRIVDIDEGNNIKDSLKSLGFSDGLF